MDKKRCSKCKQEKDLSEFNKNNRPGNGFQSCCKSCNAAYRAEHREELAAYRAAHREAHREEIAAHAAAYYAAHREELVAYQAAHREAHREEIAARAAAYYAAHREKKKARQAAYRAAHREEIAASRAAYYAAHRDEIAASREAYYAAHPDKIRVNKNKRRARKRCSGGTHTSADVQRQGNTQRWHCWWCGEDCKDKYHVDHLVPLARGGHNGPGNLVIACPHCNLSKHDKLPEEWAGRLL